MAARSSTPERRRPAPRSSSPRAEAADLEPRVAHDRRRKTAIAALVLCVACGLPRDPESTAARVAAEGARVGVVLQAPWACERDGLLAGVEIALLRRFARARGIDMSFETGGETRLLAALQRFELDLVIGGLVEDNPWDGRVGFTRPYHEDVAGEHVLAVPPGENAWTMQLEAFLAEADLAGALARGVAECGDP
jgi:ABC-type amino acid transport substrate-binding protein